MFKKEIATLGALSCATGVAKFHASGTMGQHLYIAMELLNTDVLKLFQANGSLSVPVLIHVAREAIAALESVHNHGYLHLDIKPDNIALKKKGSGFNCYLVDFGMAVKYLHNGMHYQYTETGEFHGNPIFASVHSLMGRRPSRRDDLESLMYMIAFLANSTLPWMKFGRMSFGDLRLKIAGEKERTSPANVCKNLPPEFSQILTQIRLLSFTDKPNYSLYQRLLEQSTKRLSLDLSSPAEWHQLIANATKQEELLMLSVQSETADVIPMMRQSLTMKPKHENSMGELAVIRRETKDVVEHRRSTKKRLTKNFERLGMAPRSMQRHSVIISKPPVQIPEEEVKESGTPPSSPFPGRKEKSRESTLVASNSVTVTDRLRTNIQQFKRQPSPSTS